MNKYKIVLYGNDCGKWERYCSAKSMTDAILVIVDAVGRITIEQFVRIVATLESPQ